MYLPPILLVILFLFIALISVILPFIKKGLFTWYITLSLILTFIIQIIVDPRTLSGGGFFIPGSPGAFTEAVQVLGFQTHGFITNMQYWRAVTSIYVHLNPAHLITNALFLLIIGLALENRVGRKLTIISFFSGGFVGELFVILAALGNFWGENPYIYGVGASGAIFGIAGALLALFPKDKILFPFIIIKEFQVTYVIGLYFLLDIAAIAIGSKDNIGHVAHVGGILGGYLLAKGLHSLGYEGEPIIKNQKASLKGFGEIKEWIVDPRGFEIFDRINNSEEREVIVSWMDEIGDHLKCPQCGKVGLRWENGRYRCPSCRFSWKVKLLSKKD